MGYKISLSTAMYILLVTVDTFVTTLMLNLLYYGHHQLRFTFLIGNKKYGSHMLCIIFKYEISQGATFLFRYTVLITTWNSQNATTT